MTPGIGHRLAAEVIGTFALVFFGAGSAIFGIDTIGRFGVACVFGLVLVALAYALGPVSGAHLNPAVTLAIVATKGIRAAEAGMYVAAQLVGGILAGAALWAMVHLGGVRDQTGGLGTNGYGDTVNLGGALAIEIAMTALLVLVILLTAEVGAGPLSGLAIGLSLAAMVGVGIPLTGASLNPARSIGPALFAGGPALAQVWVFIVAPLIGALVAVGLARAVAPTSRPSVDAPL